ncbi:MAG: Deoxyuridine 5'-triphosphate nucleotidohydrolase [Candidatus Kapaibacterium sp.]|nr:MAG: Deoxyuridine 5'-triphosphate nucleotidohydrolase [Candidatus Kapabacteria bacterium]ROL56253.1 MAG: dUTP diphosphatase [Bacteroidetes/Chlorobi group bacterium Naka2016]
MKVQISRLSDKFNDIPLPEYQSEGSAGMDIRAAVENPLTINPGEIVLVPTNLAIALPKGYECQVRTRSGLALRHGIFALNSPGTIDSDYRGEIRIILANFSKEPFVINRGDRIAQLVVAKYERVEWEETNKLPETVRGDGGFGSTGI